MIDQFLRMKGDIVKYIKILYRHLQEEELRQREKKGNYIKENRLKPIKEIMMLYYIYKKRLMRCLE